MTKFRPKLIDVTENPVLIIGERPNTTRDNSTYSLVGNRTGDFVAEAIGDSKNIILTNVVNELYSGSFRKDSTLANGILELMELIEDYKPCKIIMLGGIAQEYTRSIKAAMDYRLVDFPHPSWINRFKSSMRGEYIKQLKYEINDRVPSNTRMG